MLLPIEVWFPAFKFAFTFGVIAIIVDALLQPRIKRQPVPPPAVEVAEEVKKAA